MKKTLCALLAGIAISSTAIAQINERPKYDLSALVVSQKKEDALVEKFELYTRAAEKRTSAAKSQEDLADKNSRLASTLESMATGEDSALSKKNYQKAGDLYLQSGDLLIAASRNHLNALENLRSAMQMSKKLKIKDPDKWNKDIKTETEKAYKCYNSAIDHYVSAAASFSDLNGDDPEKQAKANERASIYLEIIAGEK